MEYVNINGSVHPIDSAHVAVDNGAFRYGYGLFETIRVVNSEIALLGLHFKRMAEGLGTIYLDLPMLINTPEKMAGQILKTIRKNQFDTLSRVRLQVFAGGGGIFSTTAHKTGFIIECFPLEESTLTWNENGLVLGFAQGLEKNNDRISHLKSCNALVYALAARQAKVNKWNDCVISNVHGRPIETAIANIFWIKDAEIYTPPVSDGCIEGVMRENLLARFLFIKERVATLDELLDADEVFLTNAIKGIKWVGAIENKIYKNTITKSIHNELQPK